MRRQWHWDDWHRRRRRWRLRWWAANVMNSATELLLEAIPRSLLTDGAIRVGARGWLWRRRWWRRWRWSWRWCRGWRVWNRHWLRGAAANASCSAAILLLRKRPRRLPVHRSACAIVIRTCEQPQQQWQQQEQTQKTARGDEASEIPSRAHCVEIASASNVLVCSFLDVLALSTTHIAHCALTTTATGHAASCAVLTWRHSTDNSIGTTTTTIASSCYHSTSVACAPACVAPTNSVGVLHVVFVRGP